VTGPNNAKIHIISGTVGDGTGNGDNYPVCQQRVAAHEIFEATTDVSGADCCTGQTPGNLCEMCDTSCAKFNGPGPDPVRGPIGWGSQSISCNGKTYYSQVVTSYSGGNSEWVPSGCRKAMPKEWHPTFYAAQFDSQSFPGTNGTLTMTVNQKIPSYVQMKNVGWSNWDANTRLATTQFRGRVSPFASADWLAPNRLAACTASAAPGALCKFEFTLQAPNTPGDFDEFFGLVQENVVWFSDPDQGGPPDNLIEAKIKVVEADYHAELVSHSYGTNNTGDVALALGETQDGWVELKNVGLQTWKAGVTKLAPTPRDVASSLAAPTWLSPARVSAVANDVPPGMSARFAVPLKGSALGTYVQTFAVVEDGVTWFADPPHGGGPADDFLTLTVNVSADGSGGGGGGGGGNGCSCSFTPTPARTRWPALLLFAATLVLLARSRARRGR
jgi:hypothetical protein